MAVASPTNLLLTLLDDPNFAQVDEPIEGEYLIAMTDIAETFSLLSPEEQYLLVMDDLCEDYDATLLTTYPALGGFHASMSEEDARSMSHDARVELVEEDAIVHGHTTRDLTSMSWTSWGLDRIDQHSKNPNGTFKYTKRGNTVHVYVIDTGIDGNQSEFSTGSSSRVDLLNSVDVINDLPTNYPVDDQGHGTACASLIGGKTVGVADLVTLHAVRALHNEAGSAEGSADNVSEGLEWILNNYDDGYPAVVSMSLGYSSLSASEKSTMKKWITRLYLHGIPVVVSAGNYDVDAEKTYPAGVIKCITVGATQGKSLSGDTDSSNLWDKRADFAYLSIADAIKSNYGSVVDLYAPGTNILCGSLGGGYGVFHGTSASAPLVAGVVAQFLGENPTATVDQVEAWLIYHGSTSNRLDNSVPGTRTEHILYTNPNLDWGPLP